MLRIALWGGLERRILFPGYMQLGRYQQNIIHKTKPTIPPQMAVIRPPWSPATYKLSVLRPTASTVIYSRKLLSPYIIRCNRPTASGQAALSTVRILPANLLGVAFSPRALFQGLLPYPPEDPPILRIGGHCSQSIITAARNTYARPEINLQGH